MMEVHDTFSITELVTDEDLHNSPRGGAIKDVSSIAIIGKHGV